jgi:hypothetical protein
MIRTPLLLIYLTGILLLGYTAVRAYNLSFTHDESLTWQNYVNHASVINIITIRPVVMANDHILNSLLMKTFSSFLGNNEIVLRIQSLLAHLLYIICSIGLVNRFKNKWYALGSFILLNVNPYMLDFFSLARGYALGNGFLMASIYFIYKYRDKRSKHYLLMSMISAALSVISIFTMIYVYLAIVFTLNIIILKNVFEENDSKHMLKKWWKANLPIVITTIGLIVFCFVPVWRLVSFHELSSCGGQANLWSDTVLSFFEGSLYQQGYMYKYRLLDIIPYLFALIAVTSLIFVTVNLFRKNTALKMPSLLLSVSMLFIPLLASQMHHWLAGGNFLSWRHTLFYVPLMMWVCVLFFDFFSKQTKSIFSHILLWIFAGFLLFHFVKSINFNYVTEWKYDSSTKAMLKDLKKDIDQNNVQAPINMAICWFFDPTINFYRESQNLKWLNPVNRNGFAVPADYYYIFTSDSDYLYKNNKIIVKQYPVSGNTLAKTPK